MSGNDFGQDRSLERGSHQGCRVSEPPEGRCREQGLRLRRTEAAGKWNRMPVRAPVKQATNSLEAMTSGAKRFLRSEEHTTELQSLMRISYAVFCLTKKK